MLFGISEPQGLESFDAVKHIDLDKCTITIDTQATNMAMWNYENTSWNGLRSALARIPLRHPLWRIAEDAGNAIWKVMSEATIAKMPTPTFDVPLVPLGSWFSPSSSSLQPRCDQCDKDFVSIGSLINHCRTTHCSKVTTQLGDDMADQDAKDAQYWQDKLGCTWEGCGKVFVRRHDFLKHWRRHTGDKKYECDWPDCDFATADASSLAVHRRGHVPDLQFACTWPGCNHVARYKSRLDDHMNSHLGQTP